MKPVNFNGANLQLGEPNDWDEGLQGKCDALPAMRSDEGFLSCWKPNADELTMLNLGGVVTLTVLGQSHPPVAVGTVLVQEVE